MDVKYEPMDDLDIKHYLPKTPTLLFRDLYKYKSLEQLLPYNICSVIVLMEYNPYAGHWISISRYNNTISYFDSYGYAPEGIFRFFDKEQLKALDEDDEDYIIKLFNNEKHFTIYYNDYCYQDKKDKNISTCGGHCINFILSNEKGLTLKQYNKKMIKMKNNTGLTFDEIVSKLISRR